MRVKVAFELDIDPEAWTRNYGVDGAIAIRKDVKIYVENGVKDQLREQGLLLTETVRRGDRW